MIDPKTAPEPLLKWPGGKRRLLGSIAPFVPTKFETYREPFFGGGALFFAIQAKKAVLSDEKADLIQMYRQVRRHPGAVIGELSKLENSEAYYYFVRSSQPKEPAARAARFIYLSNLSFNGIHRVNRNGDFNVPYGQKVDAEVYNEKRIRAISKSLKSAELKRLDFEDALADSNPEDFVYLDPPYTVAHGNNGFVKYNSKIFSWEDQRRLARTASRLRSLGCHVLVSNADHPSIRALYPNFSEHIIERHSIMAASSAFRKPISESLFCSGDPTKC